jgi:hypothetical protein
LTLPWPSQWGLAKLSILLSGEQAGNCRPTVAASVFAPSLLPRPWWLWSVAP